MELLSLMKKFISFISIGIVPFLGGCSNYRVTQEDIGRSFVLNKPSFLVETKVTSLGIIPLRTYSNLCAVGTCPTCRSDFPGTAEEFNNNKESWQQGRGDKIGICQEKILGLIPKGTHYVIVDRYSGGFNFEPYELIRITEGPFAGKTTYHDSPS
jgi:hypothetical protein